MEFVGRIPGFQSARVRLDVLRGGQKLSDGNVPHDYSLVSGVIGTEQYYRTDQHCRLVSNGPPAADKPAGYTYDDEYDEGREHQTVLVKLGDTVRATLVKDEVDLGFVELPVGRPASEGGLKAIRTVDVKFFTFAGVTSAPQTAVDRASEDLAQVAVRCRLDGQESGIVPANNTIALRGEAAVFGILKVDVGYESFEVFVPTNTTADDIAEALANKIDESPSYTASVHPGAENGEVEYRLVVVRTPAGGYGDVKPVADNQVSGVTSFRVDINLNKFTPLMGDAVGLNYKDEDHTNVDVFVVNTCEGGISGFSGSVYMASSRPGLFNSVFIKSEAVDQDDAPHPFVLGHEIAHILRLDDYEEDDSNLMKFGYLVDPPGEGYESPKRLTEWQNEAIRALPIPPVLEKE